MNAMTRQQIASPLIKQNQLKLNRLNHRQARKRLCEPRQIISASYNCFDKGASMKSKSTSSTGGDQQHHQQIQEL